MARTIMNDTATADDSPSNIRAAHYYVLEADYQCPACKHTTRVVALAVPGGHQCTERDTIEEDDDFMGVDGADFREWLFAPEQWYDIAGPAIITSVAYLPDDVIARVNMINPHYGIEGKGHDHQWRNHCAHCGTAINDADLHVRHGYVFSPDEPDAIAHITMHAITAPFSAYYGMCWHDHYTIKQTLLTYLQARHASNTQTQQ